MATPTTVTTYAGATAAMKAAYYREQFLDYFFDKAPTLPLGVRVPLPSHEGKTVDWPRMHELALVESAGTEGTYGDTTEKGIEMMNITASLSVFYQTVGFSSLYLQTTRDRDPKSTIMGLLGRNAGASMEWQVRAHVAQYGMTAIRVDQASKLNNTWESWDMPVGRNNTLNTTTAIHLPTLTGSAGYWRGAFLTIKRGKAEGQMVRVTAWNASTVANSGKVATVSPALTEAIDTDRTNFATGAQTFVNICQPYRPRILAAAYATIGVAKANASIKSGDKLTIQSLIKATQILDENGAERFPDGNYKAFVSVKGMIELQNDSNWLTAITNTARTGLETGQMNVIGGCTLIPTTLPVTYDKPTGAAGGKTFQTTARGLQELEVTLVFGQNAFGIVDLDGDQDSVWDPRIIWYNEVDTYNKHGLHAFATWVIHFAVKSLNANYCVGIISYRG